MLGSLCPGRGEGMQGHLGAPFPEKPGGGTGVSSVGAGRTHHRTHLAPERRAGTSCGQKWEDQPALPATSARASLEPHCPLLVPGGGRSREHTRPPWPP